MQRSTSPRELLAHILLIAVVLVWGTTFPLVKAALHDISPLLFNLLRMSIAAIVMLAILLTHNRQKPKRAELRLTATAGLFLALGYQFQTSGLAHTTPSKSAFLTGLVVVFVPILSLIPGIAPPSRRRPNTLVFLGAILAFAGLILLTSQPGTGAAILSGMHLGEWLTLACAVAFAAHLLTLAHAAPQLSARRLGTLQIAFAAVFMLFTLPLGGHPTFHLTPIAAIALAITALFATAAAFTIQSWAQQLLPPTHTALILTLEPVFAALTSLLFFHERFGPPRTHRRRPHPRRHPPRRTPHLHPHPRQRPRIILLTPNSSLLTSAPFHSHFNPHSHSHRRWKTITHLQASNKTWQPPSGAPGVLVRWGGSSCPSGRRAISPSPAPARDILREEYKSHGHTQTVSARLSELRSPPAQR